MYILLVGHVSLCHIDVPLTEILSDLELGFRF